MAQTTPTQALFEDISILEYPSPGKLHDTDLQYGENGHKEYAWSSYIREKITQLSFQLTRTYDISQQVILGNKYNELLQEVFLSNQINNNERKEYISILYRLLLHTRDIISGKGEYRLFYVLLSEWVKCGTELKGVSNIKNCSEILKCIDELSKKALDSLISIEGQDQGYGSWKDIKYFLTFLFVRDDIRAKKQELPIFRHAITLVTKQLRLDEYTLEYDKSQNPSLLAKWLPREKSKKFGWLAKYIACDYYSEFLEDSPDSMILTSGKQISFHTSKAKRKCLTHYRKLLSNLNRKLETVQINQCNKTWGCIDFDKKVTSMTLNRQKNAFQYTTKQGYQRGYDIDRVVCKLNYEKYINECKHGLKVMKGNRVGPEDLVKDALYLNTFYYNEESDEHKNIEILKTGINEQWKESEKKCKSLENVIAMIDTSASMEGEPMNAALGLGCRIAENSLLGRRVLTFDAKPKWIDLTKKETLTEMMETIMGNMEWGLHTNFVAAMQLILDACIEKNFTQENISELTLVVLSDMQIDNADKNHNSMGELIDKMFYDAGLKTIHATPYKPPHIIYWNLRSLTGFPTVSTVSNVSMLSGYSPNILQSICNKGKDGLQDCTPWNVLENQLSNKRYTWVDNILEEYPMFNFNNEFVSEEPENITIKTAENKSWFGW